MPARLFPMFAVARLGRLRLGIFGTTWALCVIASRTCFAEPHPFPPHIEVVRTPDASACPDAVALAADIASVGGHETPVATPEPAAPIRFDVAFARSGSGHSATIRESGVLVAERTIVDRDATCLALAEAVVATITMMLDGLEAPARDGGPSPPLTSTPAEPARPPAAGGRDSQPPDKVVTDPDARTADNLVFAEAFGNGQLYSINYEHIFADTNASVRVGFGYYRQRQSFSLTGNIVGGGNNSNPSSVAVVAVPLIVNYYVGASSHKLQFGAGVTLFYRSGPIENEGPWTLGNDFIADSSSGVFAAGTVVVGYRYVPQTVGVTFGIGFTPIFNARTLLPWAGIDAGVVF